MPIPKLMLATLVLAVVFSGCGEKAKTRFPKGKDRTEYYKQNNLCGERVAFCVYDTSSKVGLTETEVKPTPAANSESTAENNEGSSDSESNETSSADVEAAALNSDDEIQFEETAKTKTLDQLAAKDALTNPAYGPVYKRVQRDILKPVRGSEYELMIKINVSKTNKETDEILAERKAIASFIDKTCVDRIENMIVSSDLKIKLKIGFVELDSNEFETGERESSLDIFVHAPRVTNDTDAKTKRLVMSRWPFHSDLFAFEIEKGDEASRMEKSEPFCQSLAKLTTHVLGVNDPVAIADECGVPQKPEASLLAKTGSAVVGYKAGKADFWETSVLKASRDRKQIFRPICPDERKKTKPKKTNSR